MRVLTCVPSAGDKRMDEWVNGLKLRSPMAVPALMPQLSGLLSNASMDSCARCKPLCCQTLA